jgi:hypothetical protein
MEAVMRCHSGATLTYRRRTEQALAGAANVAPAKETGNVMQIGKPTLPTDGNVMLPTDGNVMQPTLQIAKGAAA